MTAHSTVLNAGETVIGVYAGELVTVLKTSAGRFLSMGENINGNLGIGHYRTGVVSYPITTPVEITIPGKKIASVGVVGSFGALITDGCDYPPQTIARSYS